MDRKLYKLPIGKLGQTNIPCPICGKGHLRVKDGTFNFTETNRSKKAHDHDEWYPDWIEYVFSTLLECSNDRCGDVVSCTGIGTVSENYAYDQNGELDIEYSDEFFPRYFVPHLRLFSIPKNTPDEVTSEIEKSFSLVFCDPESASNHVRTSLENLLTHLKIKRFSTSGGKRKFLSLHNRINLLPTKYQQVQDLFLAIKWLGNAGSHSNSIVTIDDVFDAYELMIELLDELFANRRKKAKQLAKQINKKKGPK